MVEERERPRPHGDPLREDVTEENRAQRQSDVPTDSGPGGRPEDLTGSSDRAGGRGSTANGVPSFDEDSGRQRKQQYDEGADLVSGMD